MKTKHLDIYRLIDSAFDVLIVFLMITSPLIVYGTNMFGLSVRFSRVILLVILPLALFRLLKKPHIFIRDKFFIFTMLPFLIYSLFSLLWVGDLFAGILRFGGLIEIYLYYLIMMSADLN